MTSNENNSAEEFLKSPLIVWIQSYLDGPITSNDDLSNGVLLNKVLNLIDPNVFSALRIQHNVHNNITSKAQNLAEILHGIKRYYLEKLQQLIVMKMPDILMLAKDANNDLSYSEMQSILLLILGCAIQCERKEEFIEHIKELEVDVQRGLVMSIQEITENLENVIAYRVNDLSELSQEELLHLSESLYYQVERVLEQRDDYVEMILDLALLHDREDDIVEESPRFRPRNPVSPRSSFRSQNILHANRQRMQSLQSELDDRNAYVNEMKEELEQMKLQLDNVRIENKQLVHDAGWAKSYRDELDVLKLQVENQNKLQADNTKLKEKIRDLEFYQKRYDELKEHSDLLYESKLVLEERMAGSENKNIRFGNVEDENNRLYSQVKLLMEEREDDQKRIKDLVDEVAKLSVEKQESMSACSIMNAELDGLRLQRQGLNVPLLMEYNQSSSTDLLHLEKENKHLMNLVESFRYNAPERHKELEEENKQLALSIFQYKTMISKLTKAMLNTDGFHLQNVKLKSLLLENDSKRDLSGVIGTQNNNVKNLKGSLTKHSSQLEQTVAELDYLTKELAKKGVIINLTTLKQALDVENVSNDHAITKEKFGSPSSEVETKVLQKQVKDVEESNVKLKQDLATKTEQLTVLQSKVEESKSFGMKVEEQLRQREKDILELERRFENNVTENKKLNQNVLLRDDKILALEERVSHLMSLTSEDTRKVNKSLEEKLQRISELETRSLKVEEELKDQIKLENLLKMKEKKNEELQESLQNIDEKHKALELQFEKAKSTCIKLEHCIKLRDERISTLESSVDELSISATSKQSERISSLMKTLDTRGGDIADLEKKVEELILLNNKQKTSNRLKDEKIQLLEERALEIETKKNPVQPINDNRVASLNKQLTDREGQIDELEVKLEDVNNNLNKSKRSLQNKEEKIIFLEQKLQDFEELILQKERLSHLLEDRSKRIIELETKLDNLQNENSKLTRTLKQKEEEYVTATQSLGTLEASITDQSSLSKLIHIKDTKINNLQSLTDEKDKRIIVLENSFNDAEGKVKKITYALKLREDKIAELEQSVDKWEELVTKNKKLQSTIQNKDVKVRELEDSLDQLNELSRLNTRLRDNVQQKEEKIAGLEQRIDDLEEAFKMNERLNQQVKQKEERILSLQQRNSELSEVKVKRQMSIMRREQKIVNLESRLNEYASEKQHKDTRIQDLQTKLEGSMTEYRKLDMSSEEKDQKLHDLELRIRELQDLYKENRKLLRALEKNEEELVVLKKKFEELDANNNRSSELLSSKEEIVKDLQERLEKTLTLNNRLDHSVKKQEEKVNNLEKQLQESESKLEQMSIANQSKDRLLERQKEKLELLQTQVLNKEQELIELDKRMSSLKNNEAEKNRLLSSLKEKESLIAELEDKIQTVPIKTVEEENVSAVKKNQDQVQKFQKKCDELSSEKHKTKLNLQEKDGIITDLQRRIEELQLTASDSDKLNTIVKDKNAQITILRNSLNEYQENTVYLEMKIDELTSDQNRSNLAIKQKEERLKLLKSQLEEHVSRNRTMNNDLQLKEEKLKSLTEGLQEMTERNKDLEEDINMLEKDLEDLKKTGSLKNITNITEKIQLTKRARTELHIQRGPPLAAKQGQKIEIKMSTVKAEEQTAETRRTIERLQQDIECLQKQKSHVTTQVEDLSLENAVLLTRNESSKADYEFLKADYAVIQTEMNEAKEHFQELDVSATKIAHRCEVLVQLNATLDEENKALMDQVNKLLQKNQELLVTTLQSRDQFLDEERAFSDHIYGLEWEKEKLSEKVVAAEKALTDSGSKKKNALWRGTHKILKKAGLSKKKDSLSNNSRIKSPEFMSDSGSSPTTTPSRKFSGMVQSPLGPIRGIISRSRQDISKIDNDVIFRRGTLLDYSGSSTSETSSRFSAPKQRPKSEFYPKERVDYESPLAARCALHRPSSMDALPVDATDGIKRDAEEECDIIPMEKQHQPQTQEWESPSIAHNSNSSTPTSLSKADTDKTPIQKVRITQTTTPKVMKASSPASNLDYIARQALEQSPRSAHKMVRASTFTSPDNNAPTGINNDETPVRPTWHSVAFPVTSSTPVVSEQITSRNIKQPITTRAMPSSVVKSPSSISSGHISLNKDHSFGEQRKELYRSSSLRSSRELYETRNRAETESVITPRHSGSENNRNALSRSESFSPPAKSHPFGVREQRSSFRRYEIEQMERRPLPRSQSSGSDNEDDTQVAKGSSVEKLISAERFGSKGQRTSLRGMQRASETSETGLRRSNSDKRKKNSTWHEYGNV